MSSASSPPDQAGPVTVLLDGLEADVDLDVVRERNQPTGGRTSLVLA